MAQNRSCLGCIAVPVGLAAVVAFGGWLTFSVLRQPLHPDPQAIPSVTYADPSPEWRAAVDQARAAIRAGISSQNLPGLSVAVGAGGELVWAEGFGWADVEAYAPVTPETRFHIGGASTLLTSAAVGLLLQQQRMRLDDQIQTYVPQFPNKRWPLTVRQLMANVGGLEADAGEGGPLSQQRCEQPTEALPRFDQDPLQFEPETEYQPSNYGWIVVSAAVQSAADRPFLPFLREQIFQPLGMENTGAESAAEENPEAIGEQAEDPPPFVAVRQLLKRLGIVSPKTKPAAEPATIYASGFGYEPQLRYGLHLFSPRDLSCYAGAMALYSTPSDLVRFGLAIEGGSLLDPETVRLLQTSQQLSSGGQTTHGLGWDLDTVTLSGHPAQAAGQLGELLGAPVASFWIYPGTGIVVAMTWNASYADTSALALEVAEAFAGHTTADKR